MRVQVFLADQQIAFERLLHPPAYTANRLARFLRVPGREVVKSVLLRGRQGFFLAVLPATSRICTVTLSDHFQGVVRLATPKEVGEVFADCEWGVVSPFGSLYGLSSVLDSSLAAEDTIVFEAHSHAEAIRMRCRDYEQLEQPVRLPFATHPAAGALGKWQA